MFVLLSKTLDLFLSPLTWALLCALASALLVRRRPRVAMAAGFGCAGILWIFSTEPVANALFLRAEARAVRTYRPDVVYDAAIVLGGGLDPVGTVRLGQAEFNAAGDRFYRGLDLLRSGQARHLILSAGTVDPAPGAMTEAAALAKELERLGFPPERFVAEARSRNTRENAVESARIARERGWTRLLLITSAFHMERAMGCFRAVGLEPDALPVDYRSYDPRRYRVSLEPRSGSLAASTDALHELVGQVVYRAMGYSR